MAQVDVAGLIATAFDHYDSRAGDPQLHTHVVIATKAKTVGTAGGAPLMADPSMTPWSRCPSTTTPREWGDGLIVMDNLLARADELPRPGDRTPYYHTRVAPPAAEQPPTAEQRRYALRREWIGLVDRLLWRVPSREGRPGLPRCSCRRDVGLNDVTVQRGGPAGMWPLQTGELDDDEVFCTMVEVVHDLIARPRARSSPDFWNVHRALSHVQPTRWPGGVPVRDPPGCSAATAWTCGSRTAEERSDDSFTSPETAATS